MATVQLYRREARDFETFDEIDRRHRDANVQSIFYYAVFYPAVELVGALAASLILWVGGARIIANGADMLTLYQWNAKIARHFFCSICGIYPFHKKRSMPDHYGINVRCLDGFDADSVTVRQADGKTMSVVAENPRPDWTGPRE